MHEGITFLPTGRPEERKCGCQLSLCLLRKMVSAYVTKFSKLCRLHSAQYERGTGKNVAEKLKYTNTLSWV
jgi:hypothetical protein